jgi:hypothetical protein
MTRGLMNAILLCSLSLAFPQKVSGGEKHKPIYVDPAGWSITRAKRADTYVEPYVNAKMDGGLIWKLFDSVDGFAVMEYLYSHDPSQYVLFAISIPDDIVLDWQENAVIEIDAICNGDTTTFLSTQFIFANSKTILGPTGTLNLPGDKVWLSRKLYPNDDGEEKLTQFVGNNHGYLATESGEVMMFTRFEFGKSYPKRIASCRVSGITPIKRRVE